MLDILGIFAEYGIDLEEARKSASKSTPAVDVVTTPLSWKPALEDN